MIDDPEVEWQSKRNRFNHDWLKNHYLLALSKLLNILDDRIEDTDFVSEYLNGGFQIWEREHSEALALVEQFAASMSPSVLFTRTPYSNLLNQLSCLPALTDALWRSKYRIDELVADARDAAVAANKDYLLIVAILKEKSATDATVGQDRELRELFASFRSHCSALAEAIELLPNRILIA